MHFPFSSYPSFSLHLSHVSGAFRKSHSLSMSVVSYLYEHSGLSERTVSGAAARSGPEWLERYRLMARETA